MKKVFSSCLTAYLSFHLIFGAGFISADDDYWGDFDSSAPLNMPEPEPVYEQPQGQSYDEPQYQPGQYSEPPPLDHAAPSTYYDIPVYEPVPSYQQEPSYGNFEPYVSPMDELPAESNYVSVIKSNRLYDSEFQDAVIEGLQFSSEPGGTEDEVIISCYFIFRDKPTSYFYDLNRKDKKLVFEFADARTGSSPVQVTEQSPIKGIVIEEMQVDANKEIKGLNPEWHNYIRVTMNLSHIPVISVSDEQNIISFKYRWTTNPEKYPQYIEPNRFPLVFWLSGGALGAIGIGLLTYFLIPKKENVIDPTLPIDDLPVRPASK
ncbi:MAG: hypothetical protein LBI42_13210 [Chitinispirillales bacterium]|jgi:hypothetical protein|nr:hypothetical protein [Chitinispirillales bacterium]